MELNSALILGLLCMLIGSLIGHHMGFKDGWANAENYFVRKVVEEWEKLQGENNGRV
jgi:hypothetical protein